MRLSNIDFRLLLPQFMRDDGAVKGLAAALDKIIPQLSTAIKRLSTWDRIDELSASELDDLAWELNISWYDKHADVYVKREIVRNSDLVHRRLGTKWAVEFIVNTYFGDGHVEEWFEYGGEPGHFRVVSSDPSISGERLDQFLSLLDKVKRVSATLDEVVFSATAQTTASAGAAIHEVSVERFVAK